MSMKCKYFGIHCLHFVSSGHNSILVPTHFWFNAKCRSGSVCWDVINQTWSQMFGKIHLSSLE
jgi:hypothetical protein